MTVQMAGLAEGLGAGLWHPIQEFKTPIPPQYAGDVGSIPIWSLRAEVV